VPARPGRAGLKKPLKRDAHGNIMGGIRLAEIAVPVALESGELCGLGGTHKPFDDEKLNKLYPTHSDYVNKVAAASNAAVKAGFLLPADADQTIDMAKRSIYGLGLRCGDLAPTSASSEPPVVTASLETNAVPDDQRRRGAREIRRRRDEADRRGLHRSVEDESEVRRRGGEDGRVHRENESAEDAGNMPAETETLLTSQAAKLRDLLRAKQP
jgi:hypothetical protein